MSPTQTIKEGLLDYSRTTTKKITNPHDKFFKETFGHIEVVKSFLYNYLPPDVMETLDISTLKSQKDSFINKELEEGFSDLLFSADIDGQEGYVYFLFEHKSYPDKLVVFQLLKYMAEIWNTRMKKEEVDQLPIILPLVVYHSTRTWNTETALSGMITGYKDLPAEIRKFVPDYEYLVYDLSKYPDEEIKGEARVKILFTMFRDVQQAENVRELLAIIDKAVAFLQELEDKQTGLEYFETFMRYIFSAMRNLTREHVDEIVKEVEKNYPEGRELVMTLADILREEGKEEGKKEGIKEVALEMLRKGSSINFVAEVTHMDVEEVRKLQEHQYK